MSRVTLILALTTITLAAAGPASAQEIPCSEGPCLRPREAGTHFIAEVNGGGSLFGARGLMVGGVFGVGGKLRGLPLRFYLVGELAYSTSTENGVVPSTPDGFRDERSHRDLAGGLRVYLPLGGPVRLFGDLLGGASYLSGTLDRHDSMPRQTAGWAGLGVLAGGVQVRLIHQLSLGARARWVFTSDDMDGLRSTMGSSSSRPVSFMAGMTWHF